jgi:hypothetical protein
MFILQLYTLLPSNNTTIPKYTVTIEICEYISDSWTVYLSYLPFVFYGIFIAQKFQLYHYYYITIYIQSQIWKKNYNHNNIRVYNVMHIILLKMAS